jgi:hypothetical protein
MGRGLYCVTVIPSKFSIKNAAIEMRCAQQRAIEVKKIHTNRAASGRRGIATATPVFYYVPQIWSEPDFFYASICPHSVTKAL